MVMDGKRSENSMCKANLLVCAGAVCGFVQVVDGVGRVVSR